MPVVKWWVYRSNSCFHRLTTIKHILHTYSAQTPRVPVYACVGAVKGAGHIEIPLQTCIGVSGTVFQEAWVTEFCNCITFECMTSK